MRKHVTSTIVIQFALCGFVVYGLFFLAECKQCKQRLAATALEAKGRDYFSYLNVTVGSQFLRIREQGDALQHREKSSLCCHQPQYRALYSGRDHNAMHPQAGILSEGSYTVTVTVFMNSVPVRQCNMTLMRPQSQSAVDYTSAFRCQNVRSVPGKSWCCNQQHVISLHHQCVLST